MTGKKRQNLDPLYQMFEHHLLTRSYDDSSVFTKTLAKEYLGYLDSTPAHVPFHSRPLVIEDLESEAREMLVKKMYGCVQPEDYKNFGRVMRIENETAGAFDFYPQSASPDTDNKGGESRS